MSVRILILGGGGREHALAWKLSQSPLLDHIYVCPGNAGTNQVPKTSNINDIPSNDFPGLIAFALKNQVRLLHPYSLSSLNRL
jgi:phosphoribosylamine--glycine ligase/phosphoribosylformylglycinamidine cyclo-ligase